LHSLIHETAIPLSMLQYDVVEYINKYVWYYRAIATDQWRWTHVNHWLTLLSRSK